MVGRIEIKENEFDVKLPVQLMKEHGRVIVFTPALDLCGYGDSAEEAKQDFENAVKIFFEETATHGTLGKALEQFGWNKIELPSREYWEPSVEIVGSSIEEMVIPAA